MTRHIESTRPSETRIYKLGRRATNVFIATAFAGSAGLGVWGGIEISAAANRERTEGSSPSTRQQENAGGDKLIGAVALASAAAVPVIRRVRKWPSGPGGNIMG